MEEMGGRLASFRTSSDRNLARVPGKLVLPAYNKME